MVDTDIVPLEVEQVVWDGPPDAHCLVRLAGVGVEDVRKDRLDGLGNVIKRQYDALCLQ